MKKEKVFIIVTQMRSLKSKSTTDWQVTEKVEFVNQIRKKHISAASAIGDYVNRTMIMGAAKNITDYGVFEEYIREKYENQMSQLDKYFRPTPAEIPLDVIVTDDREVRVIGENITL